MYLVKHGWRREIGGAVNEKGDERREMMGR